MNALTATIAAATDASGRRVDLDWGAVLTGRAALLGWDRSGTTSVNRACRLLPTTDGWVALNLARPEDVASLPALLAPAGVDPASIDPDDPWPTVRTGAAALASERLVAQAVLLGVPAAALRRPLDRAVAVRAETRWEPRPPISVDGLRVLDLSAMWAGPLACRILAAAGAAVTKVELAGRPDGARGHPDWYRWLHHDAQEQIVVDATTAAGRRQLRALVAAADVVVESSRPRALSQLGTGPGDVPPRSGRIWLGVSGHGRGQGADRVAFGDADRVAFGDDAAVAGGLVAWSGAAAGGGRPRRQPVFVADAVADPVTGMVAAGAVLEALAAGGGVVLDVALAAAAAWLAAPPRRPLPTVPVVTAGAGGGWDLEADGVRAPILAPVARPPVPEPAVGPGRQ